VTHGQHYYEARFAQLAPDAVVQIGFAPSDVANGEMLTQNTVASLSNNGQAHVNATEKNWHGKFGSGDVIGCYLDRPGQTVRFFVNGTEVLNSSFDMDAEVPYFLAAALTG
jgi:hypothetical protein